MKIIQCKERSPELLRQLLEVWENSVKATHLFEESKFGAGGKRNVNAMER